MFGNEGEVVLRSNSAGPRDGFQYMIMFCLILGKRGPKTVYVLGGEPLIRKGTHPTVR